MAIHDGYAEIASSVEIAAQSEMIYQAITSIASASSVSAEAYYLILAASALADRKSTRLNSSHSSPSRMPSSA